MLRPRQTTQRNGKTAHHHLITQHHRFNVLDSTFTCPKCVARARQPPQPTYAFVCVCVCVCYVHERFRTSSPLALACTFMRSCVYKKHTHTHESLVEAKSARLKPSTPKKQTPHKRLSKHMRYTIVVYVRSYTSVCVCTCNAAGRNSYTQCACNQFDIGSDIRTATMSGYIPHNQCKEKRRLRRRFRPEYPLLNLYSLPEVPSSNFLVKSSSKHVLLCGSRAPCKSIHTHSSLHLLHCTAFVAYLHTI